MTNNYCPRGKNGKIKTIRVLGTLKSLFYQNTSSTRKKLKKKNEKKKQKQGLYFYKESMRNFSFGGNTDLFLTRKQKIVYLAMNSFQCFTRLDTHFQMRHFFKIII